MASLPFYPYNEQDEISRKLLNWYDLHQRTFPWRMSPTDIKNGKKIDPYHVWLSEIMLQQTKTEVVQKYFIKFITLWPSIKSLAQADIEDIMKAWAGLGYYSRAHNLLKCARHITQHYNGEFPQEEEILKTLPGIGPYTAAAICAIAFNKASMAIDGNIKKILARLFAINTTEKKYKELALIGETILCRKRPGDCIQAMMDLASLICFSKKPLCNLCPLQKDCHGYALKTPELFPTKAKKKLRIQRFGSIFIARRSFDGAILMKKRTGTSLLGGMTEFPTTPWTEEKNIHKPPFPAHWIYCKEIKHIFSHFSLYLGVYSAEVDDDPSCYVEESFWSYTPEKEALPSLMQKALSAASWE